MNRGTLSAGSARVWLAALLACALAALAASPAVAAERRPVDTQLLRGMADLVERGSGPPLAIAVIQRGSERRVFRVGFADLADHGRARARMRMRIASTSKAMSGGVALSLVAEGLLSLDDTIGELLPELPSAWHRVTLEQLLHHTSGLPDFTASEAFGKAVTGRPDDPPPPRDLLEFVANRPLEFEPGTSYAYSNSDNVLVGLMAEAATAGSYPALLDDRVFEPLRMGRSRLGPNLEIPEPFIHGYDDEAQREDVTEVVDFGGWAWASGGVVSTPGNLNRFIRGYVGAALFSGPGLVRSQREWRPGDSEPRGPGKNSAGLALFRYRTNCGTVLGHTGSILGYTQLMAASPNGRRSLTFTISTQADGRLLYALRRAQRRAVCAALG